MQKAYLAVVQETKDKQSTLTVGANSLSSAAKKAEAAISEHQEIVKVELTKDVIL